MPEPLPAGHANPRNPAAVLHEMLKQCSAPNLGRAKQIAEQIRNPEYQLRHFYTDICVAFPEMRFYFVKSGSPPGKRASAMDATTSGLEQDQEYLRTVGAFFAVYWLMRIGIDGERGFSLGVDEESWAPLFPEEVAERTGGSSAVGMGSVKSSKRDKRVPPDSLRQELDPQAVFFQMSSAERQLAFLKNTRWDKLNELLIDAGLLVHVKDAAVRGTPAEYKANVDRVVGLLALTAIHDIMKVDQLLPVVQPQHAPYEGFKAGDKINDHDVALGYMLRYYPAALPSFAGLSGSMRETIQFTQVKIMFNHGWLVQAEAPPGPLFSHFKNALVSKSNAADANRKVSDVNFYFVHWLTDLAGAEPTPLKGSEKLVLKFPHPVLHSFISSFAYVGALVHQTETAVFEAFLLKKWDEVKYSLGAPPVGKAAIALMRLITQVQHLPLQQNLVTSWSQLSEDDKSVLCHEMSLTGCPGQNYEAHKTTQGGPVFLLYYSPAFLRTAARSDALSGLRMLADVYRQARSLWPFSEAQAAEHVTIRIDQIKEHPPQHVMDGYLWGESWLLVKRNEREAVIERHTLYMVADQSAEIGSEYRILAFWAEEEENEENAEIDDFLTELAELRRQRMELQQSSRFATPALPDEGKPGPKTKSQPQKYML